MPVRGMRHSVVGIIATTALLLAGCSSGDPSSTGSQGPSTSASPTVGPSDSPSGDAPFDRRDPGMTDLEAQGRLVAPLTGETWHVTPQKIATPAWAVGDPDLDSDYGSWYELGIRGSITIIGFSSVAVEELFERAGDGSWEWISFPSGRDEVTPTADSFGYAEAPVNTTIYYDSLTLPAAFTLPSGEPLIVPDYDWGSIEMPGREDYSLKDQDIVDRLGGYKVARIAEPSRWIWSDPYPISKPEGLTYEEFFYVLVTPYGMIIPLEYAPLGEITDISWSISTNIATDGYTSLADLNDIGCGPRDSDHNTTVFGTENSDWVSAGTAPSGKSVYIPSTNNPLTRPMYDVYSAFKQDFGETPVSLNQFLNGPALIGYKTPGTGDWVVYLNSPYSGRAWC